MLVLATTLLSSMVLAAKVVHIEIAKANQNHSSFMKRDQTGLLGNQKRYYSTDILVGSPGQKLSVDIDTGSGDLWIFDVSTPLCQSGGCFGGTCKWQMIIDPLESTDPW
jgi:hypothetical protein